MNKYRRAYFLVVSGVHVHDEYGKRVSPNNHERDTSFFFHRKSNFVVRIAAPRAKVMTLFGTCVCAFISHTLSRLNIRVYTLLLFDSSFLLVFLSAFLFIHIIHNEKLYRHHRLISLLFSVVCIFNIHPRRVTALLPVFSISPVIILCRRRFCSSIYSNI